MSAHERLARDFLDIFDSLNESMKQASGMPLKYKDLEKTNLKDFLFLLAPNGIRFTYNEELVDKVRHEIKYYA